MTLVASTHSSDAPVSRQFSREERREQLVELAGRMALEHGISAVTMENLAAAAEVNKRIVYRVFPNRSAVLAALFEREFGPVAARIVEESASAVGPEGRLRAAIRVWFDAVARSEGLLPMLLDSGQSDPELRDRRDAWEKESTLAWALGIAQATGAELDDAMDATAIVLAGMRGALSRWLDDGRPREVLEDRLLAIALAAVDGITSA